MGTILSREIRHSGAPTPLSEAEGHTDRERQREFPDGPARSETRRTYGSFLRETGRSRSRPSRMAWRDAPARPLAEHR